MRLMKRYWNNKGRIFLALCFLLCTGIFLLILYPDKASSGPYLNSAHGNYTPSPGYGVLRTSLSTPPNDYGRGNCVHCHEQHAMIGGAEPAPTGGPDKFLLFAPTNPTSQNTNFCFNCHKGTGSLQTGGITNNNYSATFGGATATFTNIYGAFNPTGTEAGEHDLDDISTEIQAHWPSIFNANSNPCSGCHNVHIAKRNKAYPGNPAYTAISRPSDHNNLWGDDDTERMKSYAESGGLTYRAPFYVGANPAVNPTLHEPDGVSRLISSDEVRGSTTPSYDTFCLDCHQYSMGGRPAIPWDVSVTAFGNFFQKHGLRNGTGTNSGNRKAPYTSDGTSGTAEDTATNFVLSCLDCHEPHGSNTSYANGYAMLRTTVNGKTGITMAFGGTFYNFCTACHTDLDTLHGKGPANSCSTIPCHRHGYRF